MTRFARGNRNKESNSRAKVPEEATPWYEFKMQLDNKPEEHHDDEENEHVSSKSMSLNDKLVTQNIPSSWCEFDPPVEDSKVKKNKSSKNVSRSERNTEKFNVKSKNDRVERKKKNKKLMLENNDFTGNMEALNEDPVTQSIPNSWSEFESPVEDSKKKKNKSSKNVSRSEHNTEEFNVKSKNDKVSKKKNKKPHLENGNEFNGELQDSNEETSESKKRKHRHKNVLFDEEELEPYGKKRKAKTPKHSLIPKDGKMVGLVKFDGFYILKTEADKIQGIKQKMIDEGRSKADIDGTVRRLRRNAEKSLSKHKKKFCFNCREGVHLLADCPKYEGQTSVVSGICYKCGSTEHSMHQCRVPGNELKFAKCFICNENGHLSKQCPDNPRGLYPHGGGCRICGDVTHFKRDCPELINKKRNNTVTVGTIGKNIESLDDDELELKFQKTRTPPKKVNKVIKFD